MIKNKSTNKVLVNKSKLCKFNWCKARGLMFSKQKKDFGLIFEFKKLNFISLHMFFVFYPIDVLFLDEDKTLVEKKVNFKPFTFYKSKKKVKYIIELPIKTGNKVNIGDKINF